MVISNNCAIFAPRNNFFVTKVHKIFGLTLKKGRKMAFSDYMKSLPNIRLETVKQLAKACRVNEPTVYRWIQGEFTPDPLKRKVIAETLGVPESELFPDAK